MVVAFRMYHTDLSVFICMYPWLTAVFRFDALITRQLVKRSRRGGIMELPHTVVEMGNSVLQRYKAYDRIMGNISWLLIALVAFLLLRRGSWRYRGGQGPR